MLLLQISDTPGKNLEKPRIFPTPSKRRNLLEGPHRFSRGFTALGTEEAMMAELRP